MISTFTVFIDANVFYGARLRSLVLALTQTGLFRARWSEDIHREWMSYLLENRPDLKAENLSKTRHCMDASVLDCLVTGYEPLIPSLHLPDEGDRHVLAAAIKGRADVIVTFNQKDFPSVLLCEYGIKTKHPDDFLMDVFDIGEQCCLGAVQSDFRHYQSPPLTIDDYMDALDKAQVPQTAAFLRERKILF